MKAPLALLLGACLSLALPLAGCLSYPSDPAGTNIDLRSSLDGKREVPPTDSAAGGYLTAQYSTATHILKWRLVVSGLSSPVKRGYFHGPDVLGNDAPLVEINLPFDGSEHIGGATLTERQAADLLAGRWYLDLSTDKYPAGEIRGQVVKGR